MRTEAINAEELAYKYTARGMDSAVVALFLVCMASIPAIFFQRTPTTMTVFAVIVAISAITFCVSFAAMRKAGSKFKELRSLQREFILREAKRLGITIKNMTRFYREDRYRIIYTRNNGRCYSADAVVKDGSDVFILNEVPGGPA